MTEKCIVLEVDKGTCTVLSADGQFRKVKARGDLSPGQEITLPGRNTGVFRYALAACLMFIIFTALAWDRWMTPAVAAYVCLDINPSVELSLDRGNRVIDVSPLNDDGRDIISGLDLKGVDVGRAVGMLVNEAVVKNYIRPADVNTIATAVTPLDGGEREAVEQAIRESVQAVLDESGAKADIVVGEISPGQRDEAARAGLTPGRYMLYLDALQRGQSVSPEDFKGKINRNGKKGDSPDVVPGQREKSRKGNGGQEKVSGGPDKGTVSSEQNADGGNDGEAGVVQQDMPPNGNTRSWHPGGQDNGVGAPVNGRGVPGGGNEANGRQNRVDNENNGEKNADSAGVGNKKQEDTGVQSGSGGHGVSAGSNRQGGWVGGEPAEASPWNNKGRNGYGGGK
ncbi:MAG: anti-sigma factor domain-containing protein [Bacillota bacterium]